MRFTRNMALLDIILVVVLFFLLYVFVHRLGNTSRSPKSLGTDVTDSLRSPPDLNVGNSQEVQHLDREIDDMETDTDVREIEPDVRQVQPVAKDASVAKKKDAVARDEEIRNEIDARLKKIPDNRAEVCKKKVYQHVVMASIIVEFFDYQLYDLKVTVGSVLLNTPADLIKEIIIVDDGSTLDHLIKESQTYVAGLSKAVLVRNEERQGRLGARLRGAREANGHNLVFLDTTVIVSKGWLEPLIDVIQDKKSVIAQPHLDKINDPVTYEYSRIDEPMVAMMSWSLTVRMGKEGRSSSKAQDDDPLQHRTSPMIHGAAWAVTKEYFEEIGKLDAGIGDGGGEHAELSLRTWFCGGEILTIPCSRVGVLNILDPVTINTYPTVWYIQQLWLGSHERLIKSYYDQDLTQHVSDSRKDALQKQKNVITQLKCSHDMNWFVETIAKNMFAPSADAVQFGFLKVKTGYCARLGADSRLDLGSCRASEHKLIPGEMSFELMKDGTLRLQGKCIQWMDTAYALAKPCLGAQEPNQYWDYKDGMLVSRAKKFCLMHVTDPDPKQKEKHRQILMPQGCDLDKTDNKQFSKFEFVKA